MNYTSQKSENYLKTRYFFITMLIPVIPSAKMAENKLFWFENDGINLRKSI